MSSLKMVQGRGFRAPKFISEAHGSYRAISGGSVAEAPKRTHMYYRPKKTPRIIIDSKVLKRAGGYLSSLRVGI